MWPGRHVTVALLQFGGVGSCPFLACSLQIWVGWGFEGVEQEKMVV